ncbi:MAG: vitamin K epoxide reductase family protein [Fimbriimonadaceae bacterium]|nr:vitamin K epoxide reductase family protein [Fimbriimonadaceae bacterium]
MLASVGLFVTLHLSLHVAGVLPAVCRSGEGCVPVLRSSWSNVFGIPVASWGLVAYLGLFVVNARLSVRGYSAPWNAASYAVSGVGALASALLTGYSTSVLRSICSWCLVSGVAFCSLLLAHALEAVRAERVEVAKRPLIQPAFLLLGVAASIGAATVSSTFLGADAEVARTIASTPSGALAPNQRPSFGDVTADAKVVVMGELSCPACKDALGRLMNLSDAGGGFGVVFRHGLLRASGDELAVAVHLESAHRAGKFASWLRRALAAEELSVARSSEILHREGVPPDYRLRSVVLEESTWVRSLGVRHSPVLILIEPGHRPTVAGLREVEARIAFWQQRAQ